MGTGASQEEHDASQLLSDFVDGLDLLLQPAADTESAAEFGPAEEPTQPSALDEQALAETKEMFGAIAADYVRPVRQFMSRLAAGPVSPDRVEMCLPAIGMVARSARQMGLESLAPTFESFETLLRGAANDDSTAIDGPVRAAILGAYPELVSALPQAFGAEDDTGERETLIVHSLLRQVPDVGKVTLDKIFGAGLSTLEMLGRATARDLVLTTGIPMPIAERVCKAIDEYQAGSRVRRTWDSPEQWVQILGPALARLEEHHGAYRRCSDGDAPEDALNRKRHRRARQEVSLTIDVYLAEMGKLRLVDEIQTLSFDSRIQKLRDFLAALPASSAQGGAADNGAPILS